VARFRVEMLDAEAFHSFAKRGIVQAATNRRHRATCPLCRRRLTLTPCQCLHDDRIPIVATFPRHDSLTFPEQQPSHRFGSFLIRERQRGEHLERGGVPTLCESRLCSVSCHSNAIL